MILRKFVVGEIANNDYLIIDNGEAGLIDCTDTIPELESVLKENNVDLKYIYLTHGHFDHIAGVKKLQDKYDLKVYLHEDDKTLVDKSNDFMSKVGLPPIDIPKIDVLLKDGDKVKIGKLEIEVIHLPGHTPGGVGYKVENMIFSGDTIFMNSIGRTDLPGGDLEALQKSIRERIFTLDDKTIIYPGHGTSTSVEFEKQYNSFV